MEIVEKAPSSKSPSKQPKEKQTAEQAISSAIASVTSFSGPTPPPSFLREYELLVPGIAKRFLEEPHLEAEHRRELEKLLVQEKIRLRRRGQSMAFFLATLSVIAAFAAIFCGYDIAGLGALFISIASFVGVFIYAKKHQA